MKTKEIIAAVRDEISARNLLQRVKEVSCYHRVQASSGYRDAAQHCCTYLKNLGISAEVLQYKANGTDFCGSYKLFQEWNIKSAYCDITYPVKQRIADFSLEPISVIQKSIPVDLHDIEVVLMDKGTKPENYKDIDLKNKIIFIHENFKEFTWAVQECGALGYITDYYNEVPFVRNREEMQDSLNYTSFWWKHTKEEKQAFGYVLSPRDGKQLTQLCKETKERYDNGTLDSPYIKVNAFVDSRLFDGHLDVVEAILPGRKKDTILIVAHLCHPCSSANDNASGVSGAMEVMRALHACIKKGTLEELEYTVKMILVPEFTGTYSYLFDGRNPDEYIAGINLDMIGGRQQNTYGPITVTHLPHALPSFTDMLASMIMKQIKEDTCSVEKMKMSLVHTADHLFQLGSDHSVLSDPMMNIPTIMLGQWPDKNYHTSTDTLDKIDPIVLKYSTTLAAAYVYALCSHSVDSAEIIREMRLQFISECNNIAAKYPLEKQNNAFQHLHAYYSASLASMYAYMNRQPDEQELQNFSLIANMYMGQSQSEDYGKEYQAVPVRCFQSQITDIEDLILDNKEYQKCYHSYAKEHPQMQEDHCTLQTICDYYVDGKRTIREIYECVNAETGLGSKEDILAYIQMMQSIQFMK